jgi:hypothetical protein
VSSKSKIVTLKGSVPDLGKVVPPAVAVRVLVEIHSIKKDVVQTLTDDLEETGWGVPIGRVLKHGMTTLTYDLEVDLYD